jgi:predicted ATPase
MANKLNKIIIKGYKSIKTLELELKNLNVLVGCNGAGKSNFISFFKLLNNVIENNLDTFVGRAGANSFFYFGIKITPEIYADLYFGSNRYELSFQATDDNKLFFSKESAQFKRTLGINTGKFYEQFTDSGHQKTKLLLNNTPVAKHVRESLESWIVYHFHDTSSTALVKGSCNINDNRTLRHDASNLAAFLYLLKEKYLDNYSAIIKTIQLVAPYFEDFILQPIQLSEQIRLEWKEKGSDEYFNANSLSDGTLRFICLATVLLQPNLPRTIIIDEPELGLHPYAINVLGSLIRKVSLKNQLIISTQSIPLINEFSVNDIITVDRIDNASVFKRHNENELTEWLEDYSVGELWEKNILGGRP